MESTLRAQQRLYKQTRLSRIILSLTIVFIADWTKNKAPPNLCTHSPHSLSNTVIYFLFSLKPLVQTHPSD